MKIKSLVCMAALLALLLAGCGRDESIPSTTEAMEQAVVETVTEPATTEEAPVYAIEDSIFTDDVEPETTEAPEEDAAQPGETTEPAVPDATTAPTQPEESTTPPVQDPAKTAYESFQNMTGEQQQAIMNSFPSVDAFFEWYYNAKAEYEAANPPIDVGNGEVDFGDIAGENNN